MAGAGITISRVSRDIGGLYDKEVVLDFEITSDDTTGLCPTQDITGMSEYVVTEVRPFPDAVSPPTASYEVRVEDENGAPLILTGSLAAAFSQPIGAHSISPLGNYPRLDSLAVLSIVDPADHETLLDIGNSKILTIRIRCEKK